MRSQHAATGRHHTATAPPIYPGAHLSNALRARLCVPDSQSSYAACEYSPIKPPRRSRRTTRLPAIAVGGYAGLSPDPPMILWCGASSVRTPLRGRRIGLKGPDLVRTEGHLVGTTLS
jgi:hypothetical protein